ncbi:DUF397 domain-containing protein [Streptomyces thinghirensis]|nr:DUF397 domain-containing protein [Streptomyces thinghirensis]
MHHRGATCGPRRVQRHGRHATARRGLAEEPAQQLAGVLRGVRAVADGGVAVRNSRFPDGPALVYTRAEIEAMLLGVRTASSTT